MSVVLNRKPDEDVAQALALAYMCKEFNCLPNAGGLLDQDAYHVWIMEQVATAQGERHEKERKSAEARQRMKQH